MAGATPTGHRRRAQPEAAIQSAVVEALRLLLGRHYLVVHVPNEEMRRDRKRAAILTGLGAVPGAADLLISGENFSAWLEVKTDAGRLSPTQLEFAADCNSRLIPCVVVRSVDDALAAVVAWGLAERARDGALRALPGRSMGGVAGAAATPGGRDAHESAPLQRLPEGGETAAGIRPRGKRCTCAQQGISCRGTANLGELWYCAETGEPGQAHKLSQVAPPLAPLEVIEEQRENQPAAERDDE